MRPSAVSFRSLPLLLLAACAGTPAAPPAAAPAAPAEASAPVKAPQELTFRTVAADTPVTTPGGGTFLVPAGWRVAELEGRYVLEDPEQSLRLTLLELAAPSAAEALDQGWRTAQPGFARPVRQESRPPPRDGWEEVVQRFYETGAAEARTVLALSRRVKGTSYVALADGTNASFDRRGAQVNRVVLGFKPAKFEEESFAGKKAHPLTPERLAAFEKAVEELRQTAGIPGAAFAVVQDGKVVLERGLGVRQLGTRTPVTPDTLFAIGSTTKSLTSLLMARLVDAGKVRWDSPVTELMPSFALADAQMTKQLTLQNTVCACTGMPRQDMEWLFEYRDATGEDRIASMRGMQPTTKVGETFQYSNPMVTAGGYMAAHAYAPKLPLGRAYDAAMKALVFEPLGMKATTFELARVERSAHARPHGMALDGTYVAMPVSAEGVLVSVRPAGGAWSTVRDMARYVQLELGKGQLPGGKRMVSEASLLKRREPQVKAGEKAAYGLGLFVQDDKGQAVIGHGGNTLGFSSDLFFLPEQGTGLVLLTNVASDGPFRNAVRRKLMEVLFDGKPQAAENLAFSLKTRREAQAKDRAEVTYPPDLAWVAPLAGEYHHEGLGTVTVRVEGQNAVLDAGEWKSTLGVRTALDGKKLLALMDPPLSGIELMPEEKDGAQQLVLEMPQMRYELRRVKAPSARTSP